MQTKRPRGRPPKFSPEQVAQLKIELCDRVTRGTLLTKAIRDLAIGWRRLARWRADDPSFDEYLQGCVDFLTEMEIDRLRELHVQHPDPAVCEMAGKMLTWWIEKRQRRTREAEVASAVPVHEILKQAQRRLMAKHAAAQRLQAEPAQHMRRLTNNTGPLTEGT
jgi:hypothetical protein